MPLSISSLFKSLNIDNDNMNKNRGQILFNYFYKFISIYIKIYIKTKDHYENF
tara:strand:- start:1202 stop:1360 length:159 start_codon:yes stop_codon:yes gene_type:complete